MVAKVINIILRFLGTIGLSSVICMSLSWITVGVLYLLLTLIPRFFSNLFNFTADEVVVDVIKNRLIPGWGTFSSIVNDSNFSIRLSILLYSFVVIAALCVVGYLVYLLTKVVKGNRFFTIIFSVIAVMFILFTFSVMYSGEDYYGIEKGLGFYLTSAILLVLLVIIKIGIAISLWE